MAIKGQPASAGFHAKTHSGAGTFDVNLPFSGLRGVECRTGGATNDYHNGRLFAPVSFTVTGSPQASSGIGHGHHRKRRSKQWRNGQRLAETTATIPLTNVTNAQTINVRLNMTRAGSTNVTIPMSLLIGDTNGDGVVNSGDALQTRNRSGQATDATNFRSDVNADGFVNSGDTVVVRSRSGSSLP